MSFAYRRMTNCLPISESFAFLAWPSSCSCGVQFASRDLSCSAGTSADWTLRA